MTKSLAGILLLGGLLALALAACGGAGTPAPNAYPGPGSAPASSGTAAAPVLPATSAPTAVPGAASPAAGTQKYPYPLPPAPTPLTGGPVPNATPIVLTAKSARAEPGKAYPFELYTHCGIDFSVDFDGSFWDLASPRPAVTAIGNPVQQGTLTLVDAGTARFTYDKGTLDFKRHSGVKTIPFLCE